MFIEKIEKGETTMKKYINVLNVIACIAVVFIHTDAAFWTFSYESYWIFANVVHCALLFCVPIFFMISGCNLIDYRSKYTTKEFVKKRINKTFLPYIAWSFIALALRIAMKKVSISEISFPFILTTIFNNESMSIYWFFIPLFAAYLCIPIISLITLLQENIRKKAYEYMLIMWLVFNCIAPFIFRCFNIQYNSDMNFPLATGYIFYIIAGYYIDNYEIKKYVRYIIYTLGISGLIANIVLTHIYSYNANGISAPVGDYLSITTVFYFIAIFTVFKYMPDKVICILHKFCQPISKLTFGIYLSHMYFWILIERSNTVNYLNPLVIICGGTISFIAAALLTIIMQKMPILNKIVP